MRKPNSNSRLFRWMTLFGAGAVGLNCTDQLGPGAERVGHLTLAPQFASAASAIVPVSNLRITLTRSDSITVAADTVVPLAAGQDSVDLGVTVPLLQSTETFVLELKLVNAAGDTVFRGGPTEVTATAAPDPSATVVSIVYSGIGADAAGVRIVTPSPTVLFGDTIVLDGEAFDSSDAAIPGTPIAWSALDIVGATTPLPDSGLVVAGTTRGPARIVAELLTGPADTVAVLVLPVPSAIALLAGNDQVGNVGTALPESIAVEVTAVDGLGVSGVPVVFAAVGDGAIDPDTAITDSSGVAKALWILGSTIGPQQATAHVSGLADSSVTFNATGESTLPDTVRATGGDGQSAVAGSAVAAPPEVVVLDAQGNPLPDIPVEFVVRSGDGSVTGASQVTDSTGTAIAGSWVLGTTAGENTLDAVVVVDSAAGAPARERSRPTPAAPGDTLTASFAATGVPGAPTLLTVVSGDGQSAEAGTALAESLVVRADDANGNAVPAADVAWTVVSGGGLVSTDSTPTDPAGRAGVEYTLGPTVGTDTVRAQLPAVAVDFTAIGLAGTPSVLAVVSGDAQRDTVGQSLTDSLIVSVVDGHGNPVPGVPVAWAVAFGNGSTSDDTTATDAAGHTGIEYTLGTAVQVDTVTATVNGLTVRFAEEAVAGPAATLTFSTHPVNIMAGGTFPAVVDLLDVFGNAATGDSSTQVSLTIAAGTGTGGAVLSGTTAVTAVGGTATFPDDLSVDLAGGGYRLDATATSLATAVSDPFDVTPGNLFAITVTSPSDTIDAIGGTIQFAATGEDAFGNAVANVPLTWSTSDPAVATPNASGLVTAVGNGDAVITATSGPVSGNKTVTVDQAVTAVAFTVQPSDVLVTAAIGPAIEVSALDALGAVVTTFGDSIILALNVNPAPGQLIGDTVVSAVNGVARFSNVGVNMGATGYDLVATVQATVISAVSAAFDVQSNGIYWINPAGGNWSNGANWDRGTPPLAADTVFLAANGTYTVTLDVTAQVGFLTVGGMTGMQAFDTGSQTLTVDSSATINTTGILQVPGGALAGDGDISVAGSFDWSGGNLVGNRVTTIEAGATLNLNGPTQKRLDTGTLSIAAGATATLNGTGDLVADNNPTLDNAGLFALQDDQSFTQGNSSAAFNNAGTFRKSGGAGNTFFDWTMNNTGVVDVPAGILQLDDGGTSSGMFTVLTPGALEFSGGTHTLTAASDVNGDGQVRFPGGTTSIGGSYNVTGTSTHITGGTVHFDAPSTTSNLTLSGGALNGTSVIDVTGTLAWTGGTMAGSGTTRMPSGSMLLISGPAQKNLNARTIDVQNSASVVWTGTGNIRTDNNPSIANAGTFDIRNDAQLFFGNSSGTFTNTGVLQKTVATGSTSFQWALDNSGGVDVQTGTLSLDGGGNSPGGTMTAQGGATLAFGAGTNTIGSAVSGAGTVRSTSGTTSVTGTYTADNTVVTGGTLNFDGGSAAQTITLTQSGGTLGGTGVVDHSGTWDWTGGTIAGSGTSNLLAGAAMTVSGAAQKNFSQRTVQTVATATITWTGTGNIRTDNNPSIVNAGTFDIQNDAQLFFGSSSGTFTNTGVLQKTVATGSTSFQWALDNSGGVDVQTGTLSLDGGGNSPGGTMTAQSGATLAFGAGTNTIGSAVSGAGTVRSSSGTTSMTGTYTADNTVVTGGTLNFDGAPAAQTVTLTHSGGTLGGTGVVDLSGTWDWTGGTLAGAGTTNLLAGATMAVSGAAQKNFNQRTVQTVATATITWTGTGNIRTDNNPSIVNAGTFDIQNDAQLFFGNSNGTFTNTGVIQKTVATGSTSFQWALDNSAAVDVQTGTLSLDAGGTSPGGTMTAQAGATLNFGGGTHTVASAMTGAGVIRSNSGTATFTGTYNVTTTNAVGGTLVFNTSSPAQTVDGSIDASGIVGGTASFDVSGAFTWIDGGINNAGPFNVLPGATLTTSSVQQKEMNGGVIQVAAGGTLTFAGTGNIRADNNPSIGNAGVFDIQTDAQMFIGSTSATITNTGTLQRTVGTGIADIGWIVDNTGTVDVQTGTLRLFGGGTIGNTVTLASTLQFDGGTFALAAGLAVTGTGNAALTNGIVQVAAGTATFDNFNQSGNSAVDGAGTLAVTSSYAWTDGSQFGVGFTDLLAGATMTISGVQQKELDRRTLRTAATATIVWTGTGNIRADNNPTIDNAGTFDIQTDAQVFVGSGGGLFTNTGTLQKSAGAATTAINWTVDNTGSIDVQAGVGGVSLDGGGTSPAGTMVAQAGSFLNFGGGTHAIASAISGAGAVGTSSGTATVTGTYNVTTTNVAGGTMVFNTAAPAQTVDGSIFGSGILSGTSSFDVSGTFNWIDGGIDNTGPFDVLPGATLATSGVQQKEMNGGAIQIAGGGTMVFAGAGNIRADNNPSIVNAGILDIQSDAQMFIGTTSATVTNTGTVRRSVGAGTADIGWIFNSTGTVDVQTGTLRLFGGGNLGNSATLSTTLQFDGGTHTLAAGLTITGAGTASLTSGTVLVPAGTATVDNFSQSGASFLGGAGTLAVAVNYAWTDGQQQDAGVTSLLAGATMAISGVQQKEMVTRTLQVLATATVTWTGTGNIRADANPTIDNAGTFDVQSDAQIFVGSGGGLFTNTGILQKSAGAGTTSIDWTVDNSGAIDLQPGVGALSLDGGGTSTGGTMVAQAGSSLNFGGGTHDIASAISGAGSVGTSGGTATLTGTYNVTTTTITGGSMVFNTSGPAQTVGGSLGGSGILGGSTSFDVSGIFNWTDGGITNTGSFDVLGGATLAISGVQQKEVNGGTMQVAAGGLVTWSGAGNIRNDNISTWTNNGTYDIQGDAQIFVGSGLGTFTNNGTLQRTVGTGVATMGWVFVGNTGTIDVQTGTLRMINGGSIGNVVTLTGTLEFAGGTHNLISGLSITGTGTASLTTQTARVTGTVTVDNFSQSSGSFLDGSGSLDVTSTFTWTDGTQRGGGTTNLLAGSAMSISSAQQKELDNRILQVAGTATVTWTGTGNIRADNNPSIVNNGTFDIQNDAQLFVGTGGATFTNNGVLRKSTAGGVTATDWTINNSGDLDVQTGTIDLNGTNIILSGNVLGDGTLDLSGAAFFSSSFTPAILPGTSPGVLGIVPPSSGLQFQGSLTFDIDGPAPGTQYDQLNFSVNSVDLGNAPIDVVGPAYVPVAGDNFAVATFPGLFNSLLGSLPFLNSLPSYAGGVTLVPRFSNTSLILHRKIDLMLSGISDIGVDATRGFAYLATGGSNLESFDTSDESFQSPFAVPGAATIQGAAVFESLGNGRVYLADAAGSVHVVDGGAAPTSVTSIPVGLSAVAVDAGSAASNLIYVSATIFVGQGSTPFLVPIDVTTNTVTANSVAIGALGAFPAGVAFNANNNAVYVGVGANTVAKVVGVSVTPITVGGAPDGIDAHAGLNKIYVAIPGNNAVEVIDGTTDAVSTVTVGSSPRRLAVDEVNDLVYVTNFNGNSISVIDANTDLLVATLPLGPSLHNAEAIRFDPTTGNLYYANTRTNLFSVIRP